MDYLRTNYKKVLKILGIFLVLFAFLFVVSYFLDNNSDVTDFQVTNLTSNSLTLSWVSDKAYIPTVQYSDSDNWPVLLDRLLQKSQAFDDRDVALNDTNDLVFSDVKAFPRNFHHITIKNLEAGKQYFFRINGYSRTYVPPISTATTLTQAEKVAEPDPVYGKVTNYEADGDSPIDGIVYYSLINVNDENDVSAVYSSTIGLDSGWSGDLSNLTSPNGSPYKWDKDNFKIQLETKTPEGDGINSLSLAEYKPLEDAVVNVRYIASDSVLGASTDASVLGISTVQKVFAGSAIENGVPVCKSAYDESCGSNCSRHISCDGNAFRAGACICQGQTNTKVTSPTTPTCPVATIYKDGNCVSTGGNTKDKTTATTPSVGGGDKVADKTAKPKDPKTRAEANKASPAGAKSSKSKSKVLTAATCDDGGASLSNSLNQVKDGDGNVIYCDRCVHIGRTANVKGTDGSVTSYTCNDPHVGWVKTSDTKVCPTNPTCPAISCNNLNNSIIGTLVSSDSGIVRCSYGGTTIPVGSCSNNSLQISATLQNNPDVCGIPNTNLCEGKMDDIKCPDKPACGDTSVNVSSSRGQTSDSVSCSYQAGDISVTGTVATCAQGVVKPITYDVKTALCNSINSASKKKEVALTLDSNPTIVKPAKCNPDAEGLGHCDGNAPPQGQESTKSQCTSNYDDSKILYCDVDINSQDANQLQNSCLNSILNVNCPTPINCKEGVSLRGSPTSLQEGDSVNCHYTFDYVPSDAGTSPSSFSTSVQMARCVNGSAEHLYNKNTFDCPSPNGINGSTFSPVKKVYAQPIPDIIDPTELSKGTYQIVVPGYKNVQLAVLNNKVSIKYFGDKNSNGIKDSSEDYIDPKTFTISVSKLTDLTTYTINTGWNLIALNFVSKDFSKASDLIKEMNNQGVGAVQISKYDNGNWVHLVYRINEEGNAEVFGNDFNLVPGEGYFIRSIGNGVVVLKGQKFTSSVPLSLDIGWNLTAILSPIDYTANSFITKCIADGAGCTTISRFDSGVYDSVVKFDDKFFGNNFDIQDTEGYFVLNKGTSKIISP